MRRILFALLAVLAGTVAPSPAAACEPEIESSAIDISGYLIDEEHLGTTYLIATWLPTWQVIAIDASVAHYLMSDGSVIRVQCLEYRVLESVQ